MGFGPVPNLMPRVCDTSEPPFAVPADIVVDLPLPPSLNRIWRTGFAKRRGRKPVYLADEYRDWKPRADVVVIGNRQAPRGRMIEGPFEAHLGISIAEKRVGDLDNRLKAALDYAQSREYVANDKFCIKVTVELVRAQDAPCGARLTLRRRKPVEAQQ